MMKMSKDIWKKKPLDTKKKAPCFAMRQSRGPFAIFLIPFRGKRSSFAKKLYVNAGNIRLPYLA